MCDDDVVEPVVILIGGRAIEIIFESLPEVVIQASAAIQQPEKANPLLYFSICSSIAATAAIMTDTNISYELAAMNKQERGRHSNPLFGLILDGKWGLRMLYLGGFFSLAGYLGTGVAAVTMCTLGHSARWIALYLVAEFAVVYLILVKTGRQYFVMLPTHADHATSVLTWFVLYLMMQLVPFTQLRNPVMFGGALFARWAACEHGGVCAAGEGHCDVEVLQSIAGLGCGRYRFGRVQCERHPSLDTLSNSGECERE